VTDAVEIPSWQVTWEGWRGGAIPASEGVRLSETGGLTISAGFAGAVALAEVFQFFDGSPWAGKRSAGASLWRPGADWRTADESETVVAFLPNRLWLLGLGNLGQAYLWMLRGLPYPHGRELELVLQDFDVISTANESTSVLTEPAQVGLRKTRAIAQWAEQVGFKTTIVERRFGPSTKRDANEPGIALCGFDNALARAALEDAGFELVVEAGLGAGPNAFMNFSLHTFPASRRASDIWSQVGPAELKAAVGEAYVKMLQANSIDECGMTQLASRSVGVPFVSVTAAAFVVAELLRRLHEGVALEVVSGSVFDIASLEAVDGAKGLFPGAFATIKNREHAQAVSIHQNA
jgi:hypothetical protein